MKDIFVEQLSLKQNAESLKHVLNQNEFKACMNKMKAAKLQCNFHVELNISKERLLALFQFPPFVKLQKEMIKNCPHGNFHVRNVVKICSAVHTDMF